MLTAFVPLALLPLPLALLACGGAALFVPAAARVATCVLSGLGALLVLFFLVGGAVGGLVQLPIGLPGVGFSLGLDPLSGFFLLPVLLCGATAAASGLGRAGAGMGVGDAAFAVLLGGMVLALMAADALGLLLGLGILGLGGVGLTLPETGAAERGPALLRQLGACITAIACLAAILGLLAPSQGGLPDLRFVAMHAGLLLGWRSVVVLLLTLASSAALAGLWPFQRWLPEATGNAAGAGAALLGGVAPALGVYVLVRVAFDLCGPMLPAWWGWPLLVLGTGSAVLAMLRANAAGELRPLVAAGGVAHAGLCVAGIGLALIARAADLPPLAALALGAALLHALAAGLFGPLLLLVAVSVERGAGTRRLDRLGGLIRGMPASTIVALVGAFGFAVLPAGAGFAGLWLLVQALLGALRIGGIGGQLVLALAMAGIGVVAGLALMAALRMIGIGFLGRPRSPRGAAAEEAPFAARAAAILLAGVTLIVGLLPGPVLGLADPALHVLLGIDEAGRESALMLVPLAGVPPYSALAVAGLVLIALLLAFWSAGRWTRSGGRTGPAWESGFAAPPAWLPFGDPLTELGPDAFSAPLRQIVARVLPARAGRGDGLVRTARAWSETVSQSARRIESAAVPVALGVLGAMLLAFWLAAP